MNDPEKTQPLPAQQENLSLSPEYFSTLGEEQLQAVTGGAVNGQIAFAETMTQFYINKFKTLFEQADRLRATGQKDAALKTANLAGSYLEAINKIKLPTKK